MLKISFTLFVFSIMILFSSCHFLNIDHKMQLDYNKSLDYFDSSLIHHFPKELPYMNGYSFSSNVLSGGTIAKLSFSPKQLDLLVLESKVDYSSFKTSLTKNYFVKVIPTDTNIILLFPYSDKAEIDGVLYEDLETIHNKALAIHNNTKSTSLPIPLFEIEEYAGSSLYGLDNDFVVYVLGAKPGRFLEEKYLNDCECLPAKWKHGYSKGVAMSDKRKIIIYWVAVW